jgi:cytoskeletal protein RodZ
VLMMGAVSSLSYLISRSASWVSEPNLEASTAASPTTAPTSSPNAAPGAPDPSPAATDKPVQVEVTMTAQSWLRVVVDGKTEYEGVMAEGTQRVWAAESQLTVRAGNAGGVMLAYNNGQAEPMGEPGAVREVTFAPPQNSASLPSLPDLLPQ